MARDISITEEMARPIVDFLALPANTAKKDSEVAAELDVPVSRVWRARRSPWAPAMTVGPMTEAEARSCCDRINRGLDHVRALVLDLHDREGWKALGYGSWGACVVAEFDQSKSSLYRQLEAGRIEREVAPDVPIGTIPEAQLRPLARLTEGERKPAYDEAVATAPNGKLTAAHVEAVVDGNSQPGNPDDPPDIARQRRNGIIPRDAVVEVTEPDPADEDEPPGVLAEQTDEEWLDECPARPILSEPCRRIFDRDALLFRRLTDAREKFHNVATRALAANRKAGPTGTYHSAVSWFLRAKHPRHWLVCKDCSGTGQVPILMIGKCPACHGGGYIA